MLHFDQNIPKLVYQLEQSRSPDVLVIHDLLNVVLSAEVFAQAGEPIQKFITTSRQNKIVTFEVPLDWMQLGLSLS